ncbi:MAG: restriction endonuclease [Methanoregula sp.]|nr:MAG: restriction endonuclease [Methanoregula sp.]
MSKLKIGEVFRYARPYSPESAEIDGYPNHFFTTCLQGQALAQLDSGINPIGFIRVPEGSRRPAILIRSSPHKIGSHDTPWQDTFDPDNGHIRYYGDNKEPGKNPAEAPGNKVLLDAYKIHSTLDNQLRMHAIPLLFYRAVSRNDKAKGYVEFNGFGIIQNVELITQYDRAKERAFPNYAFDFVIFDMGKEHEEFEWDWINDRRNPEITIENTLSKAPESWKNWIKNGPKSLERNRRYVSKLLVATTAEQQPNPNSREEIALNKIYEFYTKKSRFEALASIITARYIKETGGMYKEGWITPGSRDHGADFYGRLDIGFGFGKVKVILLGQAKCESPDTPTSGTHIARTVARLKRGWVGAYVTTSYFSESVQREIIEDSYPILLINGKKLAETALKIVHDDGYPSIESFLADVDTQYENKVKNRRPEELLFE